MLTVGEIIDERYRVDGFLGEGGMCTVYRATQISMERTVALKLLHSQAVVDQDAVKRFQREALSIGTLKHPNIIEAYGFGEHEGAPYMAIEFLEGESLFEVLKREMTLPKERFVHICKQICDALEHAHSQGIVHRDLKPSNVMLLAGDKVKVVDFGIAKLLPESGKQVQRLTQTGDIFGTLLYMSPEQVSEADVDGRSDIYALGCNMYEMLAGRPPFIADTPYAVIAKHLNTAPSPNEGLGQFEPLIFYCLAKDRKDRPQTAEVKDYLDAPSTVPRLNVLGKRNIFTKRNKAFAVIACTIALAVGGVGLWQYAGFQKADEAEQVQVVIQNADLLIWKYKWPAAESQLLLALQLSKNENERQKVRARLAKVYYKQNKETELKTVLAEFNKYPPPELDLGEEYGHSAQAIGGYYCTKRNWAEARKWFKVERDCFQNGKGNVAHERWALIRMAWVELQAGNYAQAIDFAKLVKRVAPEDTVDYRQALFIMADCNYMLARNQQDNPAIRLKHQAEGDEELELIMNGIESAKHAAAAKDLRDEYGGKTNIDKEIDMNWLNNFHRDARVDMNYDN